MSTQNSPEVYVPSEIYGPDGTDVSRKMTVQLFALSLQLLATPNGGHASMFCFG